MPAKVVDRCHQSTPMVELQLLNQNNYCSVYRTLFSSPKICDLAMRDCYNHLANNILYVMLHCRCSNNITIDSISLRVRRIYDL